MSRFFRYSLLSVFFLAGCTTIQARESYKFQLPGYNKKQAFEESLSAATSAGMTVLNTDAASGTSLAIRSGSRFLTYRDPQINVIVRSTGDTSSVEITSIVPEQLYDWGTSKRVVQDFCSELQKKLTSVSCPK